MARKWKIIAQKYDDLIKQLLFNRGIKTEKEQIEFFNPKIKNYEKELNLAGIDSAKKRIEKAIKNQELIIVYGDYDADGLCASAIAYLGLTALGAKVLPYIPHRENEGYGMSETGLKYCQEKGAKLIITVDNGIIAVKEAQMVKKLGMDLIITDHHVPIKKLPESISIIHSTKMCGAAVVWCLIRKMVDQKSADDLLDLVGIATVCDMMPLLGVNRALVKNGLEKLNTTKKMGLIALIDQSKLIKGQISAYHIGNILGPRLNAKGRLENAMDGLRLLCTKDPVKARQLAQVLGDANNQRKQLVEDGLALARQMIGQNDKKIIILESSAWIAGIVGLIAGKIREEYNVPAIVISRGEIFSKGSGRSIEGINLIETMRLCSENLLDVGGHPGAVGFDIETVKIELFKENIEEVINKQNFAADDNLIVEAEVNPEEITKELVSKLDQFEPTGMGNLKPILASMNMQIDSFRTVGDGKHLKLRIGGIDAIAFSFGDLVNKLKEGQKINLAYNLEMDHFNGNEKIQMKVVDIWII